MQSLIATNESSFFILFFFKMKQKQLNEMNKKCFNLVKIIIIIIKPNALREEWD